MLRILCEAFHLGTDGRDFRCERRLVEEAHKLNKQGKMIAPIIDDAHLMETDALRRIRLLLEDFPKNHNLVLVAQPALLHLLSLTVNEDIHSRVTYSVQLQKLAPDDMQSFIIKQLDRVVLPHSTFTPERNVLTLLHAALRGAQRALRDEHPTLDTADTVDGHAPIVVETAALIHGRCDELLRLLDIYDRAVDNQLVAYDHDIPF